jgi:hypothetical protein
VIAWVGGVIMNPIRPMSSKTLKTTIITFRYEAILETCV